MLRRKMKVQVTLMNLVYYNILMVSTKPKMARITVEKALESLRLRLASED